LSTWQGHACVKFAKALGWEVTVFERNADKREDALSRLGVDHFVSLPELDNPPVNDQGDIDWDKWQEIMPQITEAYKKEGIVKVRGGLRNIK
jgi:D-arabinose 1-dehydrogenase-like Zn-dependent alcohol dehydrogenase